jgi:hypothetical protein
MGLETFSYQIGKGWAVPAFPALDSEQTLVLVFGAPEFADQSAPIEELCAAYPASTIIGCSTAGEIHGATLMDRSLSVAVMRFARTKVASAWAPVRSAADSFAAGDAIARQLDGPTLRGVLVLSDGLKVNGSDLIRGLNSVLAESVVVTGGLAGDGEAFKRTWVLRNGRPDEGGIAAVGLYGEHVHIGHGSRGGWDTFGPERLVTRSSGNVLFELDGKPALPIYKEYLGDQASGLPATALLFPLSVRRSAKDEARLVRTVLAVREDEQSMVFAGDIPEGSLAQLMYANFDRLVQGAEESALCAGSGQTKGPLLSIAISCVGRRLVLGERAEDELEGTLSALPPGTKQAGFYSYGEISPFASGRCDLHNQTMTLTVISEA